MPELICKIVLVTAFLALSSLEALAAPMHRVDSLNHYAKRGNPFPASATLTLTDLTVTSGSKVGFGVGTGTDYAFDNFITSEAAVDLLQTTFQYDALGRRIARHEYTNGTLDGSVYYYYDGDRVIEERNGTASGSSTLATYVYGNYVDEVLQMQRGANTYYYHADDLFNVVALTDPSGMVIERYDYADFGQPSITDGSGLPRTTSAVGNPYAFNGQRYDQDLGLYHYRARYMDPRTGRFLQRDPIGMWGDSASNGNAYAYVNNNPWSLVDPYGHYGAMPGMAQYYLDQRNAPRPTQGELSRRVERVATTGLVVGLNIAAWSFTGPFGGLPVSTITVGVGGATAYSNRQAQYMEATGEVLPMQEGLIAATGDVTGASAMYTVVSGQDPLTGEHVGAADRIEAGAHLAVGLAGAHVGSKVGALGRPSAPANLLGRVEPPQNLKPGTTAFGNEMHARISIFLKEIYPDVEFNFRISPGERGVDIIIPRLQDQQSLGFSKAEIKPRSPSGQSRFGAQIERWGHAPGDVAAITYDAEGNIYWGF